MANKNKAQVVAELAAKLEAADAAASSSSNPPEQQQPIEEQQQLAGEQQDQTALEPAAEAAPPEQSPAPALSPQETSYKELQGAYTRSRQELAENRKYLEASDARIKALEDHITNLQSAIIRSQAPPAPEPDWNDVVSNPELFDQRVAQVTKRTTQQDPAYDPSIQRKMKAFVEVNEFQMEHPDVTVYAPLIDLAFQKFPSLSRDKAGLTQAYEYAKALVDFAAGASGTKPGEGAGNAGNGRQPENSQPNVKRPLTPAQASDAAATAAKLKNQSGVALNGSVPKPAPKDKRQFVASVIEKYGGLA